MSAIVYSFAVDSGLAQVPGTAPLAVLSRQIPRQVVLGLNSGRDRGLRFFPFMGQVEGVRRFFELPELLAVPELLKLHGQSSPPQLIVDGCIHSEGLRLRISEGEAGALLFEEDLGFDPEDPWSVVRRIQFELLGFLGWSDLPPEALDIQGEAAGWFLIARDDLLALEANHLRSDPGRSLRAIAEAFARSPQSREVRELLLEICARMAQQKIACEAVCALLLEVAPAVGAADPAFVDQAASIVETASGMRSALPLYEVQADAEPAGEAAVKAGMVLFHQGDRDRALQVLRRAFEAGNLSASLRAQLAVVEGECGNAARSTQLLDELADESVLTSAVTRLVTNYLLLNERNEKALTLLDGAIARDAGNSGLYLDRGRVLLAMRRGEEAAAAFRSCLENRPSPETKEEVRRYLSLVDDPQTLSSVQDLEAKLAKGDLRGAVALARQLCRERPGLPEAWLLQGVARQRSGQLRRALTCFRHALRLNPGMGEAHNRIGILLALRKKAAEGYVHLRQAAELNPEDSSPWLHLAQVCVQIGKIDEGEAALQKAEALGGHEAEAAAVRRAFFAAQDKKA